MDQATGVASAGTAPTEPDPPTPPATFGAALPPLHDAPGLRCDPGVPLIDKDLLPEGKDVLYDAMAHFALDVDRALDALHIPGLAAFHAYHYGLALGARTARKAA